MPILDKRCLTIAIAVCFISGTEAYTNSHDLRRNFAGVKGLKKSGASPPATFGPQSIGSTSQEVKKNSEPQQTGLSQAAINIDAGFPEPGMRRSPSFPHAAHGMLSPEIVNRMDENTMNGRSNLAVGKFLHTYRRKGPMSCLEMLSDPEILPHLTQAMRDIV
mmetsp:Transcript_21906/g.52123  ORF Transcript_21906/g.52123 Transcript_21906/m.52123 type:complete len:162 (+) Transcript_21906:190-675(+)|eukprot:CAMPEP_0197175376 /NCGR_PEP_ID=MMETSP1423-20130617/1610_1 /TAXON_ID=476441 /ORGANISM="Pseudo-nitzschia heimii, Strain UNC1101" /LENGTH=161 /DNA_ID=CAMNT_0042624515 /DNA_START=131 /DNA_END=616 /DNA_ORIENTATION=+